MSGKFSMEDYVDVAERIRTFKEKHPDGSLQTIDWSVQEVGNRIFIVYRAAAYRTPDDPRPGHGIAWEPFPGGTSFTKDSELMNAETAAWGRAIVAIGLAAKKIASKQEVKARQSQPTPATPPKPVLATESQRKHLSSLADELALSSTDFADAICAANNVPVREFATLDDAYVWCDKALHHLSSKLVEDVEKRLRTMAGQQVAA